MIARVLKYPLRNGAEIPDGALILHCGMQNETITIWALVDELEEGAACTRTLHVFGTGHEIEHPERLSHIGTVLDGPFVWHVFEEVAYEARRIIDEIDEAETIDDLKWLLKRIVRELIEDHGE